MKLILLAAGEGSRLKSVSNVKPLACLFGLTLLERTIKTAEKAGVSEIYLVIGYAHEEILEFISLKNLPVKPVYNPEWKRGNGTSVLAAEPYLKDEEEFLIAMADHLSDGTILKALIKHPLLDNDLVLAVDIEPATYIDLEDATRVLYDPESLKLIKAGKMIPTWNGIDTGFFKATPAIFEALRQTLNEGSLTAAVNHLAAGGRVRIFPVKGNFWLDIDTEKAYQSAKELILERLAKPTDGPVAKFINRRFSIPLSAALSETNLTPNQISVLSFFIAAVAAFLFSFGNQAASVLAGLLTQIASIVDGCDGEVARLKLLTSDFGSWFDAVLDRLADGLLLTGITIGLLKNHFDPIFVFLAFAGALIGSYLLSYTADKYDYLIRKGLVRSIRIGRDLRLFIIFIAGLLNLLLPSLLFLAVISFAEVIRRVWIVYTLSKKEKS
jgi:CDP-L-myo-inositol myo-inositolphosphotransferase